METNSQLELFIDEKLIGFEQNMAKLQLNDDNDERKIGKNMQPKIIFEELIFDNDNNNDDNNNSENDETDDNSSLMSTSLSSSSSYVISNSSSSSNSALSVPSFFETMDRQYEKRRPPFHQQHSATPTATIRI